MHKNHEEICKLTKNTGKAEEFFKSLLAFTVSPDRLKHLMEKHLEEYTLVEEGTSYGLTVYDHIVLNGETVDEDQVIY